MSAAATGTKAPGLGGTTVNFETLPQELKEKWLAHKNRLSANHPLYGTASKEYGVFPRGSWDGKYESPKFGVGKGVADSQGAAEEGNARSTLDTGMAKHRYLKELDPF